MNDELHKRVSRAVAKFWRTRKGQSVKQGSSRGKRDQGARTAVTGGKQLDGFVDVIRELLMDAGLPDASIFRRAVTLPGYFRPTKDWDLLVVDNGNLIASIEFKSQVGPSFGNNFNNRTEEAIGSATDLWTAHREGIFKDSIRPWLGYFMLLEDTEKSNLPVSIRQPHFPVFPEFVDASYASRYMLLCQRLVRERLYDAACFLMSPAKGGKRGKFTEPCDEVSFVKFAAALTGHVAGYVRLRNGLIK